MKKKKQSFDKCACRIPTWRKVERVDALDPAAASSAVSSVLNADDRSLQRPRSRRHRLPQRAPLTTLFCNANTST